MAGLKDASQDIHEFSCLDVWLCPQSKKIQKMITSDTASFVVLDDGSLHCWGSLKVNLFRFLKQILVHQSYRKRENINAKKQARCQCNTGVSDQTIWSFKP